MTVLKTQVRSSAEGPHLVLYDGVCGLCNRLLQFLLLHDRQGMFVFAPLQSPTGRTVVTSVGGDPDDLNSFYVFTNYQSPEGRVLTRAQAALFVARTLGWPWKAAAIFGILPTAALNEIYDLVARHRYQVFGRREHCLLPTAEDRKRFVDFPADRS